MSIVEYYTTLSSVWEEIEAMNILPVLTTSTTETVKLLKEIETQKEESKLFQFLNGFDDVYSSLRSQLLMRNPLPTVEIACSTLQQE